MKMQRSLIVLALVSALSGCQNASVSATPAPEGVAIEQVIGQVKQALANAQGKLKGQKLPPLKSVTLSLQTVTEKKAGGEIKLLVVSIGGSTVRSRTQQIDLVLVPPEGGRGENISPESITSELENAIVAAAEGVKKAGEGTIPLLVGSLEVQLAFAVTTNGNAGLSGIELGPIGVGVSGEAARASTQTLTVTYAPKE